MQETPRQRFHDTLARLDAESPIMQQQGNPQSQIKPRKPIIDNDYHLGQIDQDAAFFIQNSYDHAKVVDIDGHVLTARQLRPNVTDDAFIFDEVISFHTNVVGTNMHNSAMH